MHDNPFGTCVERCPVSVIIVNWNTGAYLRLCLAALREQTLPPEEIIVVDNASADDSAVGLEALHSRVRVLRMKENIGFAAANNLAVRRVSEKCKWIALLNPDAFPQPGWLESLLEAAGKYSEYAFFGSRLLNANALSYYDGKGDVYHVSGLAWREAHGDAVGDSESGMKEIFSPCAAAALYRRDAFLEAEGFDEDFFCYMEDVDLGFRLRNLGCRCLYVPKSVVHHIGSAAAGRRSDFSIYHGHRNLVWTFFKNMPGPLFWPLLPAHLALNFATCIYFVWMGQGRIVFRAKWDAFKGLPKIWRRRRRIQAGRRASALSIWRALDKRILLHPFRTRLWFQKGVK